MTLEAEYDRLHRDLGFRKLNPTWAKLEMALGLSASVGGLLCAVRAALAQPDVAWTSAACGAALHALGTYLAMAGHRSQLYQSQSRLTAYLLARLAVRESPGGD